MGRIGPWQSQVDVEMGWGDECARGLSTVLLAELLIRTLARFAENPRKGERRGRAERSDDIVAHRDRQKHGRQQQHCGSHIHIWIEAEGSLPATCVTGPSVSQQQQSHMAPGLGDPGRGPTLLPEAHSMPPRGPCQLPEATPVQSRPRGAVREKRESEAKVHFPTTLPPRCPWRWCMNTSKGASTRPLIPRDNYMCNSAPSP